MAKFANKPIHRLTNNKGTPTRVELQGAMVKVKEVLEHWADTGQWWKDESEKYFYRLLLAQDQIVEIFKDLKTGQWQH